MKKYLLIGVFSAMALISCRKDKVDNAFDKLTLEEIKALESKFDIQGVVVESSDGVVLLKEGTIIVYKTSANTYGKLELEQLTADKMLVFKFANFDENGISAPAKNITLGGNSRALDFETGTLMGGIDNTVDLYWNAAVDGEFKMVAIGASFYVYSKK